MNRYVAGKVLKPDVASESGAVQQFIQQGELVAQIQHRNILPVYDTGQEEGIVYRASRYVETGTLHDHLYEFKDPRQALGLINALTEVLEFIHAKGYVHGNLKPSNIFLDEEKNPLLTDFGMPQRSGGALTPYLSPEQVQGGAIDRRTDVYAMGVLLYEMLVGEAPPTGTVVSLYAKRPDVPQAAEQVILKAMAQNPDARFQSASEFRNALDAALRPVAPSQQPTDASAQYPPPAPAAAPPERRTNWLAIVLGILLILAICLGGYFIIQGLRDSAAGDTPVPTEAPPVEETVAPEPTEPPQEPTQPPVEQPTEEPPTAVQLPEEGGGILDQICGGSIGLIISSVVLSGVVFIRKRKNTTHVLTRNAGMK
jgi:serine/threonine protein kinase